MFLRSATTMIALMIAGKGEANGDDKCFCPVAGDNGESGKCERSGGSRQEYARFDTGIHDELRCQDFCAQDPDRCRGFTYFPTRDGDNCYLYDYVPGSVRRVNAEDEAALCYGMSGDTAGYTELDRKPTGPQGGKCSAPIYDGTYRCGGVQFEPYCAERIIANTLQECKDWCTGRGNLCQGFDFDEGQAERGYVSCWERRFKPDLSYAPNSRKDYTDWFCHAKECDCDITPPLLCRRFLEPADRIVGDEVCTNTLDECVATADLSLNNRESCDQWCERGGLRCTGAWDDGDFCEKKGAISCGRRGNKRSICRCEP